MSHEQSKVKVFGQLATDPKLEYTSTSEPIARFELILDNDGHGADGQCLSNRMIVEVLGMETETIILWLHRGDHVFLEGRLSTTKVELADRSIYSSKIVIRDLQFNYIDIDDNDRLIYKTNKTHLDENHTFP